MSRPVTRPATKLATKGDARHVHTMPRRVTRLAAAGALRHINRAICLGACGSTQDEALLLAAGTPGLLVSADQQQSGRGRLGREWADAGGLGIAATFVLDAREHLSELVSLACGLAACIACERACASGPLPSTSQSRRTPGPRCGAGLKWPNDVVECLSQALPGRKLAGVLVERRGDLLLAGVGINVAQQEADFPPELRTRAASLEMIGARAHRLTTLTDLTIALDRALRMSRDAIVAAWLARDLVTGREATFEHDGQHYGGRVVSIHPLGEIEVRTDASRFARLPAMQTTMVPGTLR